MEIPERWLEYLYLLDQYFYQAVLAGGCLRDLDYDKEIKDVDIFVYKDRHRDELAEDLLDDANALRKFDLWFKRTDVLSYVNPRISYAITMLDGSRNHLPLVQMIYTKAEPPSMEVPYFDFGICQIWCGLDGEVHTTKAYDDDKLNKTLTITRCDDKIQAKRTRERIYKFLTKFPDHRLVIPEQYHHLLGEANDYSRIKEGEGQEAPATDSKIYPGKIYRIKFG